MNWQVYRPWKGMFFFVFLLFHIILLVCLFRIAQITGCPDHPRDNPQHNQNLKLCLSDFSNCGMQLARNGTNYIKVQTCSNCVRWGLVSPLRTRSTNLEPIASHSWPTEALSFESFFEFWKKLLFLGLEMLGQCLVNAWSMHVNAWYSLCVVRGNFLGQAFGVQVQISILVIFSDFHANLPGSLWPKWQPASRTTHCRLALDSPQTNLLVASGGKTCQNKHLQHLKHLPDWLRSDYITNGSGFKFFQE